MTTWKEGRISDACASIDYGLTASAEDKTTGLRFLRITDIVNGHDWIQVPWVSASSEDAKKYRLDKNDIVVARTGATTGHSAIIKNAPEAVFASYLVRLKTKEAFDPDYLYYWMQGRSYWSFINAVKSEKSAQPNASASTIASAPFFLPKMYKATEKNIVNSALPRRQDRIKPPDEIFLDGFLARTTVAD